MAFFSYHWPGNVREVDRIARLMLRHKLLGEKAIFIPKKSTSYDIKRIEIPDSRYTSLAFYMPIRIMHWVSTWGGDKFLISQLKKHGLNLSGPQFVIDHPFSGLETSNMSNLLSPPNIGDEGKERLRRLEVKAISEIDEFTKAYHGFIEFCGLFGVNVSENTNILPNLKNGNVFTFFTNWVGFSSNRFHLWKCLEEKTKPGHVIPEEVYDFWYRLYEEISLDKMEHSWYGLEKLKDFDQPPQINNTQDNFDIHAMTENQLLKIYYEGLLKKTGGIVKEAAKIAGLKETTFRAKLDRMKVPFRRSDKPE